MAPPATNDSAPAIPSVNNSIAPGAMGGPAFGGGESASGSEGGVDSSMVGSCRVRVWGQLELLHRSFLNSCSGSALPAGRAAARIDALQRGEGPANHGLHHRTSAPVAAK